MRRVLHLLLIFFVTGCSTFNFGRATPTPAGEDLALGRFMARAPVAVRAAVTPTPAAAGAFSPCPWLIRWMSTAV
jgi:hypothetical protein